MNEEMNEGGQYSQDLTGPFVKKEQEAPGSHYYYVSNTTGLVFFFLQDKTNKQTNKQTTLSWGITLSFPPLSHLQSTPGDN